MERHRTQIGGWAARSQAARMMSVLAVAGALLGSLARPAAAQTPSPYTDLRMDFFRLDCYNEDDDGLLDLSSEPPARV